MTKWAEMIETTGEQACAGSVKKFEELLGFNLPDGYREFLLEFNGGRVALSHYIRVGNFFDQIGFEVNRLFPLAASSTHFSLVDEREGQVEMRDCLRQSIRIADDTDGVGKIYMILDGKKAGFIYYVFSDDTPCLSEEDWNSNRVLVPREMRLVARSFEELARLIKRGEGDCWDKVK